MANLTTLLLTVALLATPLVLFFVDRLPTWLQKFPICIVGLVVLLRLFAFWEVDLTDAHVVGYLPNDVTGLATLMYIFSGPDGLMLGLLFGFSAGLTFRVNHLQESRWSAFIWVLILGWEINPDGFATIASTPLSSQPSVLDWQSLAYPIIGLLLSGLVVPSLTRQETASSMHIIAIFCVLIAFIDLTNSPIAWMLLGITAHRSSALRVDSSRGIASRRRWVGLLVIFVMTVILLLYSVMQNPSSDDSITWAARYAIGWILLCGILGALTPLAGFDAHPRPEAWGFLTGMVVAPALLPNIAHIGTFQLPLLIAVIIMPWIGTLPEARPKLSRNRRLLELTAFTLLLPLVLYLSPFISSSILALLLVAPLLIRFSPPVKEEE